MVTGTSSNDAFSVREVGTLMTVKCGGATETFALSEITSVDIRGGAGNDQITYDSFLPVILDGEEGKDTLRGGVGSDLIIGGDGDDNIKGVGGNDTILGGTGEDRLTGGGGHDFLYSLSDTGNATEASTDELRGDNGSDRIYVQTTAGSNVFGGNGKDIVYGGSGDDTIRGQGGDDRIEGFGGDDSLEGNNGDDDLIGGPGDDTLKGVAGDDLLTGGSGNDSLSGSSGNDALDAASGHDILAGGSGYDLLAGGDGRDTLTGGGDDDILIGGRQDGLRNNYAAILAEWSSSSSYSVRRNNILDGSGSGSGANGSSFISTSSDGLTDVLRGSADNDVFFADTSEDNINDNVDGESIEQLGSCSPSTQQLGIADLAEAHAEQGRATMSCHLTLSQVAQARAEDLATRNYFGHTNPDGDGPNQLVREAGYILPSFYSTVRTANNIESITAGTNLDTAQEAFDSWLSSGAHRPHLLGLTGFTADQIEFGVGYAFDANSDFGHYWVFISAYRE